MINRVAELYCVLLLIVAIIGFIRYPRLTFPFKLLTWSVVAVFLLNVISYALVRLFRDNRGLLQVETPIEYVFYSLIYYYLFKSKAVKNFILISIALIVVFSIFNALFLQPFRKTFPTNVYFPVQILMVIYSLMLFKQMLLYPIKINITRQSVFWYNTATLFYATTMFLNLGISNYVAEHGFFDYAYY